MNRLKGGGTLNMFKNKGKSLLAYVFFLVLAMPMLAWAGGGTGSWIDAGRFALVVEMGIALSVIFMAWVIKEKVGIHIPKIVQGPIIWIFAYIIFGVILRPPIPFQLLAMYMGVITIGILLYLTIDQPSFEEFSKPIRVMLQEDHGKAKLGRYVTFTALPLLIGIGTYNSMLPKFAEPIELRTVHPAPPASINVHDNIITLQTAENPYRRDDSGKYLKVGLESVYHGKNPFAKDAPKFLQNVRDGGQVFFGTAGCFFCHGDNLDGRGPFAFAFNPIPANFSDPGTIAQLQETFVFWRVSKGGPGLSREGFPWASAMPPWEKHLTTDDMWQVILFEYWHTGFFPRTWD